MFGISGTSTSSADSDFFKVDYTTSLDGIKQRCSESSEYTPSTDQGAAPLTASEAELYRNIANRISASRAANFHQINENQASSCDGPILGEDSSEENTYDFTPILDMMPDLDSERLTAIFNLTEEILSPDANTAESIQAIIDYSEGNGAVDDNTSSFDYDDTGSLFDVDPAEIPPVGYFAAQTDKAFYQIFF